MLLAARPGNFIFTTTRVSKFSNKKQSSLGFVNILDEAMHDYCSRFKITITVSGIRGISLANTWHMNGLCIQKIRGFKSNPVDIHSLKGAEAWIFIYRNIMLHIMQWTLCYSIFNISPLHSFNPSAIQHLGNAKSFHCSWMGGLLFVRM